MELKILGSVSPIITKTNNCPGYLVDNKILLDCGSGISRYLDLPKSLNNLNIIISHLHKDHYLEIYNLIYLAKEIKENISINLYLPKTPKKIVKDIKKEGKILNIHLYNEKTKLNIEGYEIDFIAVKHTDSFKSYAIRIKKDKTLVYSGDCSNHSKEELISFAFDSDLLLCDAKFLKKDNIYYHKYHLTAYEASIIAKESKTKKLVLTHLPSLKEKDDHLKEAKKQFNNTEIALVKKIIKI